MVLRKFGEILNGRGEALGPKHQAALRDFSTTEERDTRASIAVSTQLLPVISVPSQAQNTTIPYSCLGCILNQTTTGRLLGQGGVSHF